MRHEQPVSDIADAVRKARSAHGWTQPVLAEKAGVSRATVARLELGHDAISLKNLRRILDVLGIRVTV